VARSRPVLSRRVGAYGETGVGPGGGLNASALADRPAAADCTTDGRVLPDVRWSHASVEAVSALQAADAERELLRVVHAAGMDGASIAVGA